MHKNSGMKRNSNGAHPESEINAVKRGRKRGIKAFLLAAMLLVLLAVGLLAIYSGLVAQPGNLGVQQGRLAACPSTPNCVSSQCQDGTHGMQPIAFTGTEEAAIEMIKAVLSRMPRITVVSERGGYLHAEATSALFRFVDDVEFLVDSPNNVIHFRSASRVGYSDLGANRARMSDFRERFADELSRQKGRPDTG